LLLEFNNYEYSYCVFSVQKFSNCLLNYIIQKITFLFIDLCGKLTTVCLSIGRLFFDIWLVKYHIKYTVKQVAVSRAISVIRMAPR